MYYIHLFQGPCGVVNQTKVIILNSIFIKTQQTQEQTGEETTEEAGGEEVGQPGERTG